MIRFPMKVMSRTQDLQDFRSNSLKFQAPLNLKMISQSKIFKTKFKNKKAILLKRMKFLSVM